MKYVRPKPITHLFINYTVTLKTTIIFEKNTFNSKVEKTTVTDQKVV